MVGRVRASFLLTGLFCAICLSSPQVYADPSDQGGDFEEPIFGLSYDPQAAHFDQASTDDFLRSCPDSVKSAQLPAHVAIFASYETHQRKVYIVGHRDNSALFAIQNGKCSAGIPSLALTQIHHSPPAGRGVPALTNEEISGLFQNALDRYTKAFGDKEHFFQWLDVASERMRSGCKGLPDVWCPPTYHSLPPALKTALAAYRGDVATDPLFDLPFDRANVRFETLQSDLLLPQCRNLLLDYSSIPRSFTLYAKYEDASGSIYVAGTGENVAIYVVRADKCEAGVPSLVMAGENDELRWKLPKGSKLKLSREEASILFTDALSRYTNAFGGKSAFFKWLDERSEQLKVQCNQRDLNCPPTYRSLPPDLLRILEHYRGE